MKISKVGIFITTVAYNRHQ